MSLMCLLRGHRAAPQETYNGGYWFSRCERCAGDMLRSGKVWRRVPQGRRVVWKSGRAWHSVAPDFGAHLPVLHRESNVPAHPRRDARPAIVFTVALWLGLQLLGGPRFSCGADS